jgi:GrpB-like predicted nucleotidyltransferase (UPF0157 family)
MYDAERTRIVLGDVSIVGPDPSWPGYFLREQELLRPFLGSIADELQHYGSTAIPGLRAKPIIDMMAPVESLDQADALGDQLASAGYFNIDAGFLKRRLFRRKVESAYLAYHLHLVVSSSWPVKNELLFRDWLLQHPAAAGAYEALKLKLAAEFGDDMPRYTVGKSSFVRKAVNDARVALGLPFEHDWEE